MGLSTAPPSKAGQRGLLIPAREIIAREIQADAGARISFWDWSGRVPEPKSGPLRFDLFPFQVELYKSGADQKEAVIAKSTQVGISAWAMRWAFYHTDVRGYTGLYVFPTSKDMYDYSALRIKPLLDASDYLKRRRTPDDPDNKGMKGVGLGMVVFRGSESKRGLDSVDADHIVFDEYDTLNARNIPDAEMRVSSPLSPGLIRRVGVPMFPEDGIDALYRASDSRQWFTKCEGCNDWQPLDFWKNVDMEAATRICRSCRKLLDVSKGEWVAEFPDRDVRGYHVSRLIVPGADLTKTIEMSRRRTPSEKQVFMNKHLGIAWAPAEGRLTRAMIEAAQEGYTAATGLPEAIPESAELVTMGVDVATVRDLNVRVSSYFEEDGVLKKKALFIGPVENFGDLDLLFQRYNVHIAVVDQAPDGRLARLFAERHPGRVYICFYDGSASTRTTQPIQVDDDLMEVRVNRVVAIDATFEMIRQQRNLLPSNLPDGYVEHLTTPTRIFEEDEFGKRKIVYRSNRPDDYAHSEVYDLVAHDLWIRRQYLDELEHSEIRPLDDMLEFDRSTLADMGEPVYSAGPGGDDEYEAGPGGHDSTYE